MTDSLIFHSSFDSTRFTAEHPDDFPNLAQAQAEAVISLLMGRSLVINNTYALDSRSVMDLVYTTLETRDRVRRSSNMSPAAKQRIDDSRPLILRWFAPRPGMDFLACCADQLRRLEPGTRFILSHWKPINDDDLAREELAKELTSAKPRAPGFLRGYPELERGFETLLSLSYYARHPGRGARSRPARIRLLQYLQDFEGLDNSELARLIAKMTYRIDLDKAVRLRDAIAKVSSDVKPNRGWAHDLVIQNGGEDNCPPFLLEQRQLVDTLYNANLADSSGSESDFLSSVPRTVQSEGLKQVNGFALELIRHSERLHTDVGTKTKSSPSTDEAFQGPVMSGLFTTTAEAPKLSTARVETLETLLQAYWELVADDDMWQPWRQSCEHLQRAWDNAQLRRQRGLPVDSELTESWDAHLDTLHARIPHVITGKQRLDVVLWLRSSAYSQHNQLGEPAPDEQAESLATGQYIATTQYIDQTLRPAMR